MHKRIWVAAAAVALLAAGCASGPPDGPRGGGPGRGAPPPGFGEDGEGPPRPRAQLFISPFGEPFRAPGDAPYPVATWFAQADADRDGKLTRVEFRANADSWFTALDKDGDGLISMPEVTRWEEELVPEVVRGGPGGGMMMGGGGRGRGPQALSRNQIDSRREGASPYSLINEPHPVRGADSDFSMTVSRREWAAAADRRFLVLDPDGDGVVLFTDLKPTPAQLAGGAAPRSGPPGGQRPPQGQRR